jgi:hypothetical protein
MQRRDFIVTLGGAAAWVAAVVSFSAAQTTFQPLPLKQFLEENGWVSLPLPDKRTGPGSVIKVTKKDGAVTMQWLGDLRRCGLPIESLDMSVESIPQLELGRASE